MIWGRAARRRSREGDLSRVRDAVRALVEAERSDTWLEEVSGDALVQLAAPLEMLTFQYYLDPPRERHLVRAARVACESMEHHLDACPADLAEAFRRLRAALAPAPAKESDPTLKEPA